MNFPRTKISSSILPIKQPSIFDVAEKAKQEGIARAYFNAPTIWKEAAGVALTQVALNHYEFTTDEVWQHLANQGIHTGENRAMGAIIQSGLRSGLIERTGEYQPTKRVESHARPVAIWRSKVYR